jgi:hypothetical protein
MPDHHFFTGLKAMVFDRMEAALHQYYQKYFIFVSVMPLLNDY